ncbi:hypothetical protein C8R43DRAFT_199678 [Mycena crocata]|nr:hypothetical protein C8R43DRAFT_199678 [Mycena crocata]
MPLVLHSSSCCDVCLDAYSDSDGSPHAIPCGHIFCRTCLVSVEPTNCPLCRKAFNRERIKKLHVDRPEADMEGDFLRRVALAFDAELEDQTRLTEELDAWLGGRSADDVILVVPSSTASDTRPDSSSMSPSARCWLLSSYITVSSRGRSMTRNALNTPSAS